jgi:hypothetical protein
MCALILCAGLISCSGSKSTTVTQVKTDSVKKAPISPQRFTYRFHFAALGTATRPQDEFWIDTSGQMTFDTHQHMKDGSWKSPHGIAYLEPRDEDSLLSFIKQDILYTIDESDVSPLCPDGDIYTFHILRSGIKKEVSFKTNTCAPEYNLLTGQQRKFFPLFLAFIDRLRVRYRPLYTE